jgi:hypothetical protein
MFFAPSERNESIMGRPVFQRVSSPILTNEIQLNLMLGPISKMCQEGTEGQEEEKKTEW